MTSRDDYDAPDTASGLTTRSLDRRTILRQIGGAGAAGAIAVTIGTPRDAAAYQDAGAQEPSMGETGQTGEDSDAGEGLAIAEDLFVPSAERADLTESSAQTAGRLRRLVDDDRGLWLDTGEGWISLGGHVFDVRAFGARGDGETDDWTAFQTALEAMTSPLLDDSTTPYGRTLLVPPGRYRLAQTLVLNRAVRLLGTGAGQFGDAVLVTDPGIIGIIVEEADPLTGGPTGRQAEGAIIERLQIESAGYMSSAPGGTTDATGAATGATDSNPGGAAAREGGASEVYGVWLQAGATLRRCAILGFEGDGIHVGIAAGEGGSAPQGSTSAWAVDDCRIDQCGGNGLFAEGNRPGVCTLLEATTNGGWGIDDHSASGNTYVQCRAEGNARGPFRSVGNANRSLFLNCSATRDQQPSSFVRNTIVVGGLHGSSFEGGNAWTASGTRVFYLAQDPGTGEPGIETAPTVQIQGTTRQEQPHLLVSDPSGNRQIEVDPTGRAFIGPLTPGTPVGGAPDADGIRLQISGTPDGRGGVRWVLIDQEANFTGWVANARAVRDAAGPDAPDAGAGFSGLRLTFQTPSPRDGRELDTLTLRAGRVGVGTTNPAAALDIASVSGGFLPPRLTTEQRDAIQTPPEGSMLYNVTTKRLNFFDGRAWQESGAPAGG